MKLSFEIPLYERAMLLSNTVILYRRKEEPVKSFVLSLLLTFKSVSKNLLTFFKGKTTPFFKGGENCFSVRIKVPAF
jgi:hypothetical protein